MACRLVPLGAVLALLAACAVLPPVEEGEGRLPDDLERFVLEGKVAWRHPEGRGNASLSWRQDADDFRLLLTGPMGQGTVLLEGGPGSVRLVTPDGEREAPVADELLAGTLGFRVPVAQARWWVLGVPAPGDGAAAAHLVQERDEYRRPLVIVQDGWRIRWSDRRLVEGYALPRRVEINRGELELRLIIGAWSNLPEAAGSGALTALRPN